jgi:hypothetical protein
LFINPKLVNIAANGGQQLNVQKNKLREISLNSHFDCASVPRGLTWTPSKLYNG